MPAKLQVVPARTAAPGVTFRQTGRRPLTVWRRLRRGTGGLVAYLFSWWRY